MKPLISTYDIAVAAGSPTYWYASWAPNSEESKRLYSDVSRYQEINGPTNGLLCWTPEKGIAYAYCMSNDTLAFIRY